MHDFGKKLAENFDKPLTGFSFTAFSNNKHVSYTIKECSNDNLLVVGKTTPLQQIKTQKSSDRNMPAK